MSKNEKKGRETERQRARKNESVCTNNEKEKERRKVEISFFWSFVNNKQVMDKIIIAEERYGKKTSYFVEDDFIDRLNNRLTVMGLVMCIFIITGTMYVGKPINCWTPGSRSNGIINSL